MLRSLAESNKRECFAVHFLYEEHDAPELRYVAEEVRRLGMLWEPCAIPVSQLIDLPYSDHYGGFAASYRLLLPSLLPDIARVLYLDADILVLDSISALWNLDMEGYPIAAVTNPLLRHLEQRIRDQLGLPDRNCYFNSGVLLLDLAEMRRRDLGRDLISFARAEGMHLSWPDQDVLNAVLWNDRLALHPRWNTTSWLWTLPQRSLPWSRKEVLEARRDPAIAHFFGPYKATHYRCEHPLRNRYTAYLSQPTNPVGRTVRNRLIKSMPTRLQWVLDNGTSEVLTDLRHTIIHTRPGGFLKRLRRLLAPQKGQDFLSALIEAIVLDGRFIRSFAVIEPGSSMPESLVAHVLKSSRWRGVIAESDPKIYEGLRPLYGHRVGTAVVSDGWVSATHQLHSVHLLHVGPAFRNDLRKWTTQLRPVLVTVGEIEGYVERSRVAEVLGTAGYDTRTTERLVIGARKPVARRSALGRAWHSGAAATRQEDRLKFKR